MHDLDWVPGYFMHVETGEIPQLSQWAGVLLFMLPAVLLFSAIGVVWSIFRWQRSDVLPILGGQRFEQLFLVRKKRPKKTERKTDQVIKRRVFEIGRRSEWMSRFKRTRRQQNRDKS